MKFFLYLNLEVLSVINWEKCQYLNRRIFLMAQKLLLLHMALGLLILFFALFLNVVTAFQAFPTNAIKNKNKNIIERIIPNEETITTITNIVDVKIELLNKVDTTLFYLSNILGPLIKNNEIIRIRQ
jgi:hypothetical protein